MNEKIKELADQAWDSYSKNTWNTVGSPYVFSEKFAELILNECFDYLLQESNRLYSLESEVDRHMGDYELCAEKCLDNIQGLKDHFGVDDE